MADYAALVDLGGRIAALHAASMLVNRADQRPANASTTHSARGEKIRKITSRRYLDCAAMIEKMREADDPACDLRH
jgi:hypothetical protein